MGLFDKEKIKDMALKAKDNAVKSLEESVKEAERKRQLGIMPDVTVGKLEYKGGHPDLTKEKSCSVEISNDYLKITCGFSSQAVIPYKEITSIHLETQEQLSRRITATRIIALGVFALAFKKKQKTTEKYFTIDFNDNGIENTVVISGKNAANAHSECYKRYKNFLSRNASNSIDFREEETVVPETTVNPYEELKQAKELLDMGIITQEEFDTKKKQLLEL